MLSLKKTLVNALALSLLFQALPAGAADVDYDKVWAEILKGKGFDKNRVADVVNIEDLLERIIKDRAELIAESLKKGHNTLVGERISGENGTGDRRFITSTDSANRDGGKMKFLKHDGETIVACRDGTLDAIAVDPSQFGAFGLSGGTKGMVYMTTCAGEQFEEKEYCDQPLQQAYANWSSREISRRLRFKGVSNKVTFIYTMSDPPGFEGCSTKAGLERLFAIQKKSQQARETIPADKLVGAPPRPGLPQGSFRESSGIEWAVRVHAACTNLNPKSEHKLKITTKEPIIGSIEKGSEFEKLVKKKIPGAKILHPAEEKDEISGAREKDNIFADGYQSPIDGSRDQLRKQVQRDFGRIPGATRLGGVRNYGHGVCGGPGTGGRLGGQQRGGAGMRDQLPPGGVYRVPGR